MGRKKLTPEVIRERYQNEFFLRRNFEPTIQQIVQEILEQHGFKPEIIIRTKTEDSFVAKAFRPGKSYKSPLSDITDITGIRVIVDYKDQAESAAQLLRDKFIVDEINSKHNTPDDVFGYSTIQFIVTLTERLLDDYNIWKFKDKKLEIQVRTKLEDAWATKSRDLLYNKEIPSEYKRAMNRLSALLELADESFVKLKSEIHNSFSTPSPARTEFPMLPNQSINELLNGSAIDSIIRDLSSSGLGAHKTNRDEYLPAIAAILSRQGVKTLEDAENRLIDKSKDITLAASLYMQTTEMTSYPLDTLLIAALAIVNNGGISPEEYSKGWSDRWRDGFLEATKKYRDQQKK
ncbi:MAG: GTP pyrophosphokinase family protein [Desulfovibrio sp.]|jgi:ppGpp synthetase/RelA/SpoT-type nucleotidyltranferase